MSDVRLRAEAAAADRDPSFVTQDRGHQRVMHALDVEGDHTDASPPSSP